MKQLFMLLGIISMLAGRLSAAEEGLIAHEWGSLNVAVGAEGALLDGLAVNQAELPDFVFRWSTVPVRVMMPVQKPILYFYSKKNVQVSVTVQMPKGLFSEWWPQVQQFGPEVPRQANQVVPPQNGLLTWNPVMVMADKPEDPKPRPAAEGTWYPILRDVDANWLKVEGVDWRSGGMNGGTKYSELERFLLYRGPCTDTSVVKLQVTPLGNGKLKLRNAGTQALGKVLLIDAAAGKGRLKAVDAPAPGAEVTVEISSEPEQAFDALQKTGQAQIVEWSMAAGLYKKEAEGMTKIWGPEWFAETGLRAFYLLPREEIDKLIPLQIVPKPVESVRVMVACIEALTPEREKEVAAWVAALKAEDFDQREKSMRKLKDLGRLAEPVLRKLLEKSDDAEEKTRLDQLIKWLNPTYRASK